LDVGVICLIERTELVEQVVVTVCIAVSRAEIVGKMIKEHREIKRRIEGGQNS
jgi:hypothetical protein